VLIEVGEGEWPELLEVVDERISAAEGFFRGGRAVLEVGPRVLVEDDLRRMRSVLERHDMKLGIVRSTTERTLQAALELGLSTSSDEVPEVPPAVQETRPVVPITPPKSPYFVHHGTLRSGQVLRKAESIVIVGDVNPGAHVISAGDVMIWGKLRGVAHAGAGGDRGAVVAALDFGPTQLRIGNVTAVAPEAKKSGRGLFFWRKPLETRPEVAHVAEGRIVVEPWDETKSGRPRPQRRA
jgi:septum site-determining protein MinC